MRRLLVIALLFGLAGSAVAANLSTTPAPKPDGVIYEGGGRVGGENVGSAVPIASFPFTDGGSTCGYANDYDYACPYTGSTSPDVVYSYVCTSNESITIDLCASSYDTKVYVYQNAVGTPIACNDDAGCGYSGYQSKLENLALVSGNTYYIVIDGYGGDCGEYSLSIAGFEPCVVDCPAGALLEGEPPCVDNYYDEYDGGCNSTGWLPLDAQANGCAVLCGKSCTYLFNGLSYRDTDWFQSFALGGAVSGTCTAEFPLQFILIYGPDCNNLGYTLGTGGACTPVALNWNMAANAEVWWWVGASVFTGVPESNYVLEVCGIIGGTPTEVTSWGAIKNQYK